MIGCEAERMPIGSSQAQDRLAAGGEETLRSAGGRRPVDDGRERLADQVLNLPRPFVGLDPSVRCDARIGGVDALAIIEGVAAGVAGVCGAAPAPPGRGGA